MKWRKFVCALTLPVFILSGCIGSSSPVKKDECEFEVNRLLDKGEYDRVIELLSEGGECYGVLDKIEADMNLASAYLGKAGFTVSDVVEDIIRSCNDTDGVFNSDNAFKRFVSSISYKVSSESLRFLKKAEEYYSDALGGVDCSSEVDPVLRDICFFKGICQITTAGTSFSLLFSSVGSGSDLQGMIDYWVSSGQGSGQGGNETCDERDINSNGVPDAIDSSVCAMNVGMGKDCNSVDDWDLIDTCSFGTDRVFKVIRTEIYPSGECASYDVKVDYKLLDENNILVATSSNEFVDCFSGKSCSTPGVSCYPKPIILDDGKVANQVEMIVDVLNSGAVIIANMVSQGEEDLEQSVKDFIKGFCSKNPGECACFYGGKCGSCSESDLSREGVDIKIGKCPQDGSEEPIVDSDTQKLLIDYLLGKED